MIRTFRWILFLPLALIASVLAGGAVSLAGSLFAGAPWYIWMVSGGASAAAFLFTAFRVAPTMEPVVKWLAVGILGLLGAMAALGPVMAGSDVTASFAGLTMVCLALSAARSPLPFAPAIDDDDTGLVVNSTLKCNTQDLS
jgi:hypothetical protein